MSAALRTEYIGLQAGIAEAELGITVERNIRARIFRIYREREGKPDYRKDPAWIQSKEREITHRERAAEFMKVTEKLHVRHFRAWWRENASRHTELLGINASEPQRDGSVATAPHSSVPTSGGDRT
jgi:hypothetical protein